MNKKKKYQGYLIQWDDACSRANGWSDISKAETEGARIIQTKTLGYLIHEDKQKIMLAHNLNELGHFSDTIAIPKGWITKRTKLPTTIEYKGEQ